MVKSIYYNLKVIIIFASLLGALELPKEDGAFVFEQLISIVQMNQEESISMF